jgi:hypothetical protein
MRSSFINTFSSLSLTNPLATFLIDPAFVYTNYLFTPFFV